MAQQLAELQRMTAKQLQIRHAELFGEESRSKNRVWLLRRVAWRVQSLAEGGLSERAKKHATGLANDADLRVLPPRSRPTPTADGGTDVTAVLPFRSDSRLPPAGTILTREYKGAVVQVQVLAQGFEYQGRVYKSLSATAKAVTGSHCNGYFFFRIGKQEDES